jgi:3-deoxy-D-manno-octulosonic-acid transferase
MSPALVREEDARSYARLMGIYGAVWLALAPLLWAFPRLRKGFASRWAPQGWGRPRPIAPSGSGRPSKRRGEQLPPQDLWQDVWLHCASGGEAYLTWELVKRFPSLVGQGEAPLRMLASAWTEQGVGVLGQAAAWCSSHRPDLELRPEYAPFDAPQLALKVLRSLMPKVVVLLETELWPGLLWACKQEEAPVLVVNGRLSRRSLAGLLACRRFLRSVAPERILAVSELDARRYALLFGADRVELMSNIKFDRMAPGGVAELPELLTPDAPFAVLGSVRAEEEGVVHDALERLVIAHPDCCVGIFPKHLGRVEAWSERLRALGRPWVLRSELRAPAAKGTLLLWDRFGELGQAYARCQAAFVGGSLKPLGGQNFLEPLSQGVIPCIGPHWENFAWVGPELVEQGLARVTSDAQTLAQALVEGLTRPTPRDEVLKRFEAYLAPRRGGTDTACAAMAAYLESASSLRASGPARAR